MSGRSIVCQLMIIKFYDDYLSFSFFNRYEKRGYKRHINWAEIVAVRRTSRRLATSFFLKIHRPYQKHVVPTSGLFQHPIISQQKRDAGIFTRCGRGLAPFVNDASSFLANIHPILCD